MGEGRSLRSIRAYIVLSSSEPDSGICAMDESRKRPTDKDAERLLLSSVVRGGHRVRTAVTDRLTPRLFKEYEDLAVTIFRLLKNDKRPDPATVRSVHEEEDIVDEILEDRPPPRNALGEDGYIQRIQRAYRATELVLEGQSAVAEVLRGEDAEEVQRGLEKTFMDLDRTLSSGGTLHVERSIDEAEAEILEFQEHEGVPGIGTGLDSLDRITYGFEEGDLVLLGGRPSQGKTALALGAARHQAVELDVPVAYFGLEGSAKDLTVRLIQQEAQVSREDDIDEKKQARIDRAVERISDAPLFINDTPSLTTTQIRSILRRLVFNHGIRVAYIDYHQLQLPDPSKEAAYDKRSDRMTGMARTQKNTARELGISICLLAQLNRGVELRSPPRPRLADLREGGEEPADKVMFVWRPDHYGVSNFDDGTSTTGLGEVRVQKHRDGPVGDTILAFLERYTSWQPYADRAADQAPPDDDMPF